MNFAFPRTDTFHLAPSVKHVTGPDPGADVNVPAGAGAAVGGARAEGTNGRAERGSGASLRGRNRAQRRGQDAGSLPRELGGRVIPKWTASYEGENGRSRLPGAGPSVTAGRNSSPLLPALKDHRSDPAAGSRARPAFPASPAPCPRTPHPSPTPRGSHCLTLLPTYHKKACSKEPGHYHAHASGFSSGSHT